MSCVSNGVAASYRQHGMQSEPAGNDVIRHRKRYALDPASPSAGEEAGTPIHRIFLTRTGALVAGLYVAKGRKGTRTLPAHPATSRRKDRHPDPAAPAGCVKARSSTLQPCSQSISSTESTASKSAGSQPMSQGSTSITLNLPAARQVMPILVGMAGNVAKIRRSRTMIVEDWSDELEVIDLD